MRRPKCVLTVLLVVSGLTGLAQGAEEESPIEAKALKTAGIEVDMKKHEVRVGATVCLERGILEFLVCLPNTFEHESIFSTKCKPSVLHLGLLAIGLEPYAFSVDEDWFSEAKKKQRSQVRIEVEYEQEGKNVRKPISTFLVNRERKDGTVQNAWIFSGSGFYTRDGKNFYAADTTGAIIGLCLKGAAVLQYGELAGIPYQGEDQGLEVNTDTVPARGTKVSLIFGRFGEEEQQAQSGKPASGDQPAGEAKP